TDKGVSSDSIDNSSRDKSSRINIGSRRDNSSSSDTDRRRSNNNNTSSNHQFFISTDSHSTVDSRPTRSSQKHQHHRKF
ncbi:unnamed protein product, partial [Closterium sp. NIES-54]